MSIVPKPSPVISLVIATYGPARRIRRCIDSILLTIPVAFELIIVDQNEGGHIRQIVMRYAEHAEIRYLRCERGLSRARNAGLAVSRGAIVCFPDDDCWFNGSTFTALLLQLEQRPDVSGIAGQCLTRQGRPAAAKLARSPGLITKRNVWSRAISTSIFVRSAALREVGGFDERLGLGSETQFQSGEETDLVLRLIAAGFRMHYDPSIVVLHPPSAGPVARRVESARAYGRGMGFVLRKHGYRQTAILYHVAYPLMGSLVAASCGRCRIARVRLSRARGRLEGWWLAAREMPRSRTRREGA